MPAPSGLETWTLSKPAVTAADGLVASQHYLASDVGARVLAAGGNAVDAAVATSFAIGTVEPWMSGLGGGGCMLYYRAAERSVEVVDFGMRAPQSLDPADYPLAPGSGSDLFNWPAVVDDRNLRGYPSMAVPGHVAGMALALQRFGSIDWADALAPAIELARKGLTVDWYATLKIAAAARDLAGFEESRRVYLPDGFAPAAEWAGAPPVLLLGRLANTLERLSIAGPEDFYRGELAQALVADVAAGGGALRQADLAEYRASAGQAGQRRYRDAEIHFAPDLTAGPTLSRAFELLGQQLSITGEPDSQTYLAYAQSLQQAYAERLETLGDADEQTSPSCTTHISVVDREGNLVALTQTLLSVFGSKVMLPQTGILMNNGIMWFDPRPGRPNSIGAGKRPLSNMCPTIALRGDGLHCALGASGGRRIMPAVFQLISFLCDYGMTMDRAFHQPRLDVSGSDVVTLDRSLDALTCRAIESKFTVQQAQHGVYPALFACPNAVGHNSTDGGKIGAAFVPSPWAKVSGT